LAEEPTPELTMRDRLFTLHEEMCKKARGISRKKSMDYSDGSDPYLNFRRHGAYGIVVRMDDKLARLNTFVKRGTFEVNDESLEDTLIDLLNYTILLRGYLLEGGK
jgi:hypothetical protein